MDGLMKRMQEAAAFLHQRTGSFSPEYGIILGTGLGNLVGDIEIAHEVNYSVIPHFQVSTVESHSGKLIFGMLGGKKVVAMQGRFHFYEGYTMEEVVFPVRVMKLLGIQKIFISNAAGSLQKDIEKGDLMVLNDHINLQPSNPLLGPNEYELGPRFPDPYHTYDRKLIKKALKIAKKNKIRCHEGVYVSVPGPMLETPAEYKYLHIIGGDAVGMSTVPEVLACMHMGLPVFAISVITDKGYPAEEIQPVTVEDVIAVAKEAEPKMTFILKELIAGL
ncbi:MAG: purine-nucleoside phosphorylase [Chitinophagales bacterium]|nr:purine-nucleoside phosphorylase [Chitinophagales bacterium]HRX24933.1 purine-nucleoside phosphorylase [Chitinophagales bacterium]